MAQSKGSPLSLPVKTFPQGARIQTGFALFYLSVLINTLDLSCHLQVRMILSLSEQQQQKKGVKMKFIFTPDCLPKRPKQSLELLKLRLGFLAAP